MLIASGQDYGLNSPIASAEAQKPRDSGGTATADTGRVGAGFARELDRALGGEAAKKVAREQKSQSGDSDDDAADRVKGSRAKELKDGKSAPQDGVKNPKERPGSLRKVARSVVPETTATHAKHIRSDKGPRMSEFRPSESEERDLDPAYESTGGVKNADQPSSVVDALARSGSDPIRLDESAAPTVAALSDGETTPTRTGKKLSQREESGAAVKVEKRGDLSGPGARMDHASQAKQNEVASLNNSGENPKERAGHRNQKQERGERQIIDIRDFRTASAREVSASSEQTAEMETKPSDPAQEAAPRLVRFSGEHMANSRPSAAAGRSESPFSAYVREQLGSEVVKQTGIILKNGNRGEIRLVLKPEHLGRVRMRVELDHNRLSGKIFVDSSFVKESFEQGLEELYRAFRSNGYETGTFEVLVDGRNEGNGAGDKRKDGLNAKTLKQLDEAVPILEEIDYQSELINLVI